MYTASHVHRKHGKRQSIVDCLRRFRLVPDRIHGDVASNEQLDGVSEARSALGKVAEVLVVHADLKADAYPRVSKRVYFPVL